MGDSDGVGESKGNVSTFSFEFVSVIEVYFWYSRAMESEDEEEDEAATAIASEELTTVVRELVLKWVCVMDIER